MNRDDLFTAAQDAFTQMGAENSPTAEVRFCEKYCLKVKAYDNYGNRLDFGNICGGKLCIDLFGPDLNGPVASAHQDRTNNGRLHFHREKELNDDHLFWSGAPVVTSLLASSTDILDEINELVQKSEMK